MMLVMASFRFVHAADLHLDTPFKGVSEPSPETAAALIDASLGAWDDLVELTLAERAQLLLLAGDIYDGAERGVRAQFRFLRGLERLAAQRVTVAVAHGNHDPVDEGWSAIASWPEDVTVFGSDAVTDLIVHRDGETLATVHGISYGRRDTAENLALRFPGAGEGFHIGVLHANVGGNADHDAYSPCTVADLCRAGYHYWALGHVHKRQSLGTDPIHVEYPGNTQGRSHKPSETGAKGALVVEVTDGAVREVRFAPCDRIRFVTTQLEIDGLESAAALRDRLTEALSELRSIHAARALVVRATLAGRGALHEEIARPHVLTGVLDDLREISSWEQPLVWWESIRDATRAEVSPPVPGTLSAELTQLVERLASDPAARAGFLQDAWADLPTRRLLAELQPGEAGQLALLEAARDLALDRLEAD
jgi:exonuclease SbcD